MQRTCRYSRQLPRTALANCLPRFDKAVRISSLILESASCKKCISSWYWGASSSAP